MKPRIMYIETKAGGLTGPARIGRVRFSRTGATLYYAGQSFQSQKGSGFKSNYFDEATGDPYWISGPRKDGRDALYATHIAPAVDADVHDEYWTKVRGFATPPPIKTKTEAG
jgi:hypothetical protein